MEALGALAEYTGVNIPSPLAQLEGKAVLHNETIGKEDMDAAVLQFASRN